MEYKPHDYQQFAINYILEHPIAAVILGMGLGKTSITLTAIEQLIYDSFEVSKVLVVDYCVKTKKWMILEFHGIDKKDSKEYTEPFCWLEDDFVSLCKYLKKLQDKGKIEVKNPIEMFI